MTGNGTPFSQCGNKDFSEADISNRVIYGAKCQYDNKKCECLNRMNNYYALQEKYWIFVLVFDFMQLLDVSMLQ